MLVLDEDEVVFPNETRAFPKISLLIPCSSPRGKAPFFFLFSLQDLSPNSRRDATPGPRNLCSSFASGRISHPRREEDRGGGESTAPGPSWQQKPSQKSIKNQEYRGESLHPIP